MASYEDDEQIERLRKWWQENWKALAAGLVLGLGSIVGWQSWQAHNLDRAGEASRLYEELNSALDQQRQERARDIADRLAEEFRRSPYAAQAALAVAADHARRSEWDAAAERLAWVESTARDPGLKRLAQLRHARVLWQQDRVDEALARLDSGKAGPFAALFEELRGDIKLSQGDRAAAARAYRKALDAGSDAPASRELLLRKLDDLADVVNS